MKADRIVTTTTEIDIEITEITLLTEDETEQLPDEIRSIGEYWWLRSPIKSNTSNAGLVYYDGFVLISSVRNGHAARPALKIRNMQSANLKQWDKFKLAGYTWTVISADTALCDRAVGHSVFRDDFTAIDANVYEKSDIKAWLEKWAEDSGIEINGGDKE